MTMQERVRQRAMQREQSILDLITNPDPIGRVLKSVESKLREFKDRNKRAIRQRRLAMKRK